MESPSSFLPQILERTPLVLMFTAPNPGPKTLDGTHTFVVGTRDTYIIDPGPDIPAYQDAVASWILREGFHPRGVLLTHGHPDHAPGAAGFAKRFGIPVFGGPSMDSAVAHQLEVTRSFRPGDSFTVNGDTLEVLATPGHTPDHVAFWLRNTKILFAGDTILGHGSTLVAPPEGNMADYLQTLQSLKELDARLIAPGHGPVIRDPGAKVDEYISHRREREAQLLAALQQGPRTVQELVRTVYVDIDPRLHDLAEGSVQAQLQKLELERRIELAAGRYRVRQDLCHQ